MRKLIFVAALLTAAALPAPAAADKYFGPVSIHADDEFFAQEIYGSVESKKAKCEKNRTVKLFYAESNNGSSVFQQIDQTTTNSKGEYEFFPQNQFKQGNGSFDEGEYFARVTKRKVTGDVCLKDDSRVIELFTFDCFSQSAEGEAQAAKRGIIIIC